MPVTAVEYLPRTGAGNGMIKRYELYLGNDLKNLGRPATAGRFVGSDGWKRIELPRARSIRYVRLRALSEVRGKPWTSAAELRIVADGYRFIARPTLRAGRAAHWPPDPDDLEAVLDLAERTLAFVEQSAPRPRMAGELTELARQAERADRLSEAERAKLIARIRRLRRRIILSHPLLDFDRLLINKRPPPAFSHQSDQYLGRYSRPGPGLVILENWKTAPKETVLLRDKLPVGSVLHPDLSFDARRILFSYCDHSEPRPEYRRFWIYEIGVDGRGLRQITGTARDPLEGYEGRATVLIEDFDPCYLPDGGIAFVSTRNQGGVRCHHGGRYCPTYTLYRCETDGSGIRPLVYGEANEWDPSVLPDGRIIWTRWDYINRHDTIYQSLWTIRPDGTGAAAFYGNYSRNPCSIAEARAIPGSRKVVATATAHHSYTSGSIIVIDPSRGQDGYEPLTRITPETPFPETEGWPSSSYATPWPISEDLFLVAYSDEPHAHQGRIQSVNAYAIYLIDTLGGRELIYRDEQCSCFSPIPLVPRPVPPALAPTIPRWSGDPQAATARFFVENVYDSLHPLPAGSVKRLRVLRIYPQPTIRVPDRSRVLFELPKRILGEVPVEPDGSVAFEAPAGQPLAFQLVDENGMAVMGMRTFVFGHPGETVGCAGCHEPRHGAPRRPQPRDTWVFQKLQPPVGPRYDGGLSFAKTVQPVLDRYCIRCHGLDRKEADLDLLGTMKSGPIQLGHVHASRAYLSLTGRPGLVAMALRNRETPFSVPMDYYS
ncbi:MAG: hypothetical protein GXP27_07850, partial [Planctomycetes bacterium]|nr:hypothetical protein [Planctomycetota bacterium]